MESEVYEPFGEDWKWHMASRRTKAAIIDAAAKIGQDNVRMKQRIAELEGRLAKGEGGAVVAMQTIYEMAERKVIADVLALPRKPGNMIFAPDIEALLGRR